MVSPTVVKSESLKKNEPIYLLSEYDEDRKIRSKWLKCLLYAVLILTLVFTIQLLIERRENVGEIDRYQKMFNDFLVKFNRSYETPEELEYRLSIFRENVREFEEEERKNPGVDFDVNHFTDRTNFELKTIVPQIKIRNETARIHKQLYQEGESRPASFDWRHYGVVTSVKNQGQCGSCWAFAATAAIESQFAIRRRYLVELSEQEMVDCDSRSHGCNGGVPLYAMEFVKRKGLETEDDYPYQGHETHQCRLDTKSRRVFIDDYGQLQQNEDFIAEWVSRIGPVTFHMNVIKSMFSYRSGIFNPSSQDCQTRSTGAHAMTIVGYGVERSQPYWIVKNSWSKSWGEGGYMRLARGVNACGVAQYVAAPIIL
ncbi:unnamed protein product [Caenorhabditis angaria]|uniref:Uncharacterized protein n=1 Tax=Caenorhabditis angaria TaxID=860376 RepID=A0A9P1N900_9PELO|nr:unnamed protein product [Caenorhabditis angaria]